MGHLHRFLEQFYEIIYFCYRKEFPLIQQYNTTTDTGWGCLVRTTQMMLARVFSVIFDLINEKDDVIYQQLRKKIITLFLDFPDRPEHPYSIHNFVDKNVATYGRDLKELHHKHEFWLSPTKVSLILKALVSEKQVGNIETMVSTDGTVHIQKILRLFHQEDEKEHRLGNKAVLLMIPNRLGSQKLNPLYIEHIQETLKLRSSVGIIGGKPSKSLYFVGFQDEYILYLDPHFVHTAINLEKLEVKESLNTYRMKYPVKMKITEMDPSMAFGFLFCDQQEFMTFCTAYDNFLATKHPQSETVFSIVNDNKIEPQIQKYHKEEADIDIADFELM